MEIRGAGCTGKLGGLGTLYIMANWGGGECTGKLGGLGELYIMQIRGGGVNALEN